MLRRALPPIRLPSRHFPSPYVTVRHASLNSAIERGLRKSRSVDDSAPRESYSRGRRDNGRNGRNSGGEPLNSAIERGSRKSRSVDDSAPRESYNWYNRGRRDNSRNGRNSGNPGVEHGFRKPRSFDDPPPRETYNSGHRDNWRNGRSSGNPGIERGFRKPRSFDNAPPRQTYKSDHRDNGRRNHNPRGGVQQEESADGVFDEDEFIRTGSFSSMRTVEPVPKAPSKGDGNIPKRRGGRHHPSDEEPEEVKPYVKLPQRIPRSSPASEFVYGTNAVEAALRCSRRKLYILYVYQGPSEDLSPAKIAVRKLALSMGIKVKMAFGAWSEMLDKMSQDRPHNGLVLEASPLPQLPVTSLQTVSSMEDSHFLVALDRQTREEAAVNGTDSAIPIISQHRKRYPVVLLLNGIVDTGNLGGITRSAYFLGIDAVVFAGRNSAPLNPVAIKSSAGAAENMKILRVSNEVDFIKKSKANGWRFYAADAPGIGSTLFDPLAPADGTSGGLDPNHLTQAPSVLMMGSEANGLSPHIKSHADSMVGIPGARLSPQLGAGSDPARVDSLNVSVAAALLMEMFLRVPVALSQVPSRSS